MKKFYFDTDLIWINTIIEKAKCDSQIKEIWFFGSRVSGTRRKKKHPSLIPDIDLGVVIDGHGSDAEKDKLLATKITGLSTCLSSLTPVTPKLDIERYDPNGTHDLDDWIKKTGTKIYPPET